jgi:hypothetical protein
MSKMDAAYMIGYAKPQKMASAQIIDLENSYGIEVDFAAYWRALILTPTKWVVAGDGKVLVARSAWESTRMRIVTGDLLVFEFSQPRRMLCLSHGLIRGS